MRVTMFCVKLSLKDIKEMKGTYEFLKYSSIGEEKKLCNRVLKRLNNIIDSN